MAGMCFEETSIFWKRTVYTYLTMYLYHSMIWAMGLNALNNQITRLQAKYAQWKRLSEISRFAHQPQGMFLVYFTLAEVLPVQQQTNCSSPFSLANHQHVCIQTTLTKQTKTFQTYLANISFQFFEPRVYSKPTVATFLFGSSERPLELKSNIFSPGVAQ